MAGKRISPERILKELAAIAFARVPDYMELTGADVRMREELKPLERAAVASIEKTTTGLKVKFYDKMKALELLGVARDEACVFEDSYVALETAKGAGLQTVGIFDKYSFGQDRLRSAADIYLDESQTLEHVIPMIQA